MLGGVQRGCRAQLPLLGPCSGPQRHPSLPPRQAAGFVATEAAKAEVCSTQISERRPRAFCSCNVQPPALKASPLDARRKPCGRRLGETACDRAWHPPKPTGGIFRLADGDFPSHASGSLEPSPPHAPFLRETRIPLGPGTSSSLVPQPPAALAR